MSLSSRLKRQVLDIASKPMMKRGFRKTAARKWVRSVVADYRSAKSKDLSWGDIYKAHVKGYNADSWKTFEHEPRDVSLSPRDYLRLYPFNPDEKWMRSRVRLDRRLAGATIKPLNYLCEVYTEDYEFHIIRAANFPEDIEASASGLVTLLDRYKKLELRTRDFGGRSIAVIRSEGGKYYFKDQELDAAEMEGLIVSISEEQPILLLPCESCKDSEDLNYDLTLRFYLGKTVNRELRMLDIILLDEHLEPVSAQNLARLSKSSASNYKKVQQVILDEEDLENAEPRFGRPLFTIEDKVKHAAACLIQSFGARKFKFYFMAVDVGILDDQVDILELHRTPNYPSSFMWSEKTFEFLEDLLKNKAQMRGLPKAFHEYRSRKKRLKFGQWLKRTIRRYRAFRLRSEGYAGRMASSWTKKVNRSLRLKNGFSKADKKLAHSWGFMPATVRRFDVTESNRSNLISEKEYHFAYPVSGKYGKWVRDRISALEIFEPYQEYFESAHYQFLERDNKLHIIPLSDEARSYPRSVAGVMAFMSARGETLRLVPSTWASPHSWKLSSKGAELFVGRYPLSEDEFRIFLHKKVKRQFLVLIDSIKDLELDEREASLEYRFLLINESGANPQISEATRINFIPINPKDEYPESRVISAELCLEDTNVHELDDEEEISDIVAQDGERDPSLARTFTEELDEEAILAAIAEDARKKLKTVAFESRINTQDGSYQGARAYFDSKLREFSSLHAAEESFEGVVPNWHEIHDLLIKMARFVPQLKFVEFKMAIIEGRPVIKSISPYRNYPQRFPFEPETVEFLKRHITRKQHENQNRRLQIAKASHNAKLKIRQMFAEALYPKGLVPYQSVRWLGDMRRDLFERTGLPLKTKFWAYKNGLLSYRIPQYGITPENREQFVSDLEYRWIRHINKKYKYWLEDKITIKYIATRFDECFPAYYFYTTWQDGKSYVVPMMNCPEGHEASFDGILQLARELGILALKPDEGSHGEGFYRLTYNEGVYMLNGDVVSEEDVLAILSNPKNRYLVTEYIKMHPQIAEIYPDAVNTIRLIVFKPDGVTPQIGNAYLRIGSSRSGYVDNMAAGGLLAEINAETGEYGNVQYLEKGIIHYITHHPDTGVKIEGVLPNWEYAKQKVLEIASSIEQLEYFGFDLALTEDGFKLPEINRFPDYPRIDRLTPDSTKYLLYKIEQKKRFYGYDKKPSKTLIKLPQRSK